MNGDDYVRRTAAFLRANGHRLAEATFARPRKQSLWLAPAEPISLTTDTHRLFYLLIRFEALALPTGPLDVLVDAPSKPLAHLPHTSPAETSSLASFRSSLSAVSRLSWWSTPSPATPDDELRFIFSTFTKLPALSITPATSPPISELAADPPTNNAIPLEVFKNLQVLECHDIDPRVLVAWDTLSQSLRSLKIAQSGIDDISHIFIYAVQDDVRRRQDPQARSRPRSLSSAAISPSHLPTPLPPFSWTFLRHLYLPNNQLTFLPNEVMHHLSSVTHLDLSSNLFVSVPPALASLPRLQSLNLSDNLIDSLVGIYLNLGQIIYLNLAHNRLESLCGLERLLALEHIDVRSNLLDESGEVARLTDLPHVSRVSVQGNPFVDIEPDYRISLFNRFRHSGRDIFIDGTKPGPYESFRIVPVALSTFLPGRLSVTDRAPVVVSPTPTQQTSSVTSSEPVTSPVIVSGDAAKSNRARKRKATRIVRLDASNDDEATLDVTQGQNDDSNGHLAQASIAEEPRPAASRHTRYRTEHAAVAAPAKADTLSPGRLSRHQRVSASVFETGSSAVFGSDEGDGIGEYRKRIEGLQKDMGDGWLKIFSQSESQRVS